MTGDDTPMCMQPGFDPETPGREYESRLACADGVVSVVARSVTWDTAHMLLTSVDGLCVQDSKARDILLIAEMSGKDTRVVGFGELTTVHNTVRNTFTMTMREL